MARIEKTVFISYRRTDVYTALAVYENLKNQGYEVFFDYRSISSGDFEQIISSNIKARAHFLLILTPTALDRCNEPGDWLRREIETAIDEKRNIIPLFFRGFRFGDPIVTRKLTGKLKNLSRYNGLNVHEDYFDEAMHRLQTQYLSIPLDTLLHPVSTEVQKRVREEQVAADKALEQIEDVKELVKHAKEMPELERELYPEPISKISLAQKVKPAEKQTMPLRTMGLVAGGLLILGVVIWGASKLLQNLSAATSEPTQEFQTSVIFTSQPEQTNAPVSTQTSIPPTPTLPIGSSTISSKDGMDLLYVPAGNFTMGVKVEDALAECQKIDSSCQLDQFSDEGPPHEVYLDAFWIDQTEVTVHMYSLCVVAGVCREPINKSSSTHSTYYGNPEFDDYPIVYVDWNMAKTYCEWANRRLPTEAEWEKAARGERGFIYPWGNEFDGARTNFCDKNCSFPYANKSYDDGFEDNSPVGQYTNGASSYKVLGMAGNVWEWVSSLYEPYPYSATDGREDQSASGERVLRGGSRNQAGTDVRSTIRHHLQPSDAFVVVGFRCAMSADQ